VEAVQGPLLTSGGLCTITGSHLLAGGTIDDVIILVANESVSITAASDNTITFVAPTGIDSRPGVLVSGGGVRCRFIIRYPDLQIDKVHWYTSDIDVLQQLGVQEEIPLPAVNVAANHNGCPTSGGTQIFVSGTNFGDAIADISCSLGGVPCPKISIILPHTLLLVTMPPGATTVD
jgi:IPT/TIG domain